MILLPVHIIIWLLFTLLRTLVILIGLVLIPTALLCKAYKVTPPNGGNNGEPIWLFTWKIMAPYQNFQDGLFCTTYFDHGFFLTSLRWSAIRNPANGLRYIPYISCKLDADKVHFMGSTISYAKDEQYNLMDIEFRNAAFNYDSNAADFWYYCFQGPYACYRWQGTFMGKRRRFWIGYKVGPWDIYGIAANDYRLPYAGFANQWKVLK